MAFIFEKERSLLRLARGTLPRAQRCEENAALREAARRLAGVRDAKVVLATLDRLSQSSAGQLPASTDAGIREQLASRRDGDGDVKLSAIEEPAAIRSRVPESRLSDGGCPGRRPGALV